MPDDQNGWFSAPIDIETNLEQGDILYEIPSPRIIFSQDEVLNFDDFNQVNLVFKKFRYCIILSQSCDISGQKSSTDLSVLLAPVYEIGEYNRLKPGLLQNHVLELIRLGKMPSHHMLNSCTIEGFEREISIVDFRQVFSLPIDLLQKLVSDGLKRVKMKSPYSEHLATAYGRSIMRVGLPTDISKFPILKPAIDKFATQFSAMSEEERISAIDQLQALHELRSGEE